MPFKMSFSGLAILCAAMLSAPLCRAQKLVYLSCELVTSDGKIHSHFDFTLDEQNGTVSYFVKEASASNKRQAVFGPDKVTWSEDSQYLKTTRSIDRVNLTFTEVMTFVNNSTLRSQGQCTITAPPERKF